MNLRSSTGEMENGLERRGVNGFYDGSDATFRHSPSLLPSPLVPPLFPVLTPLSRRFSHHVLSLLGGAGSKGLSTNRAQLKSENFIFHFLTINHILLSSIIRWTKWHTLSHFYCVVSCECLPSLLFAYKSIYGYCEEASQHNKWHQCSSQTRVKVIMGLLHTPNTRYMFGFRMKKILLR